MCLYSRIILNPKYKENKKNGGNIPAVSDSRTMAIPIGCGHCIECRKQKQREWHVRLLEEIKHTPNGKFVTLTFNTESIERFSKGSQLKGYALDNHIATQGVRYFTELWRKHHKKAPRHWFITELGHENTEHIHLHGIIWTDANFATIRKHWKHGYIYPRSREEEEENYVTARTINYCIKYVSKMDVLHKTYRPIVLASMGIGRGYTHLKTHTISCIDRTIHRDNKGIWSLRWYESKKKNYYGRNPRSLKNNYNGDKTKEYYTTDTGHKIALPIYYRNKLYSEEQREALWIQKLDKEERYVCKEKVDIKKGMDEYFTLVDYYREKNTRLGYGRDNMWRREEYEYQRRILIQNYRLGRTNNNKAPSAGPAAGPAGPSG